jgi:hypothetical protein
MFYLAKVARFLSQAVPDAVFVVEKWRQETTANIAIFVNRRIQHGTTVFPVPGRIIRSPAEKRDTEWRSADNHQ